jgi:type II secretory pathway component PulJ
MFTGIFASVLMMAFVVYTSVLVSSYFAQRTDKRIDKMTSRLDEFDPDCPICKTEKDDA